jgi:hypothetical protein
MKKVQIILEGYKTGDAKKVQDLLHSQGRTDVEVYGTVEDPDCGCDLCTMRREAEAAGRNVMIHPSLKTVDGFVRDVVRHRVFEDTIGNKIIFDQLFHPATEFNDYVVQIEKTLHEDFPVLASDEPEYRAFDHSTDEPLLLDCLRGTLNSFDGRQVEITMLSGPTFDQRWAQRRSQAH